MVNKAKMIPSIDGALISKVRQEKSLSRKDLADKLCLGENHIRQLEEGGESAFYSKLHKVQVAKKVAQVLEIDEYQIFGAEPSGVDEESQSNPVDSQTYQDVTSELEKIITKDLNKKSNKIIYFVLVVFIISLFTFWLWDKFQPNVAQLYKDATVRIDKSDSSNSVSADSIASKTELPVKEEVTEGDVDPCELKVQEVIAFTASKANFPGNFIYLVSKSDQQLCVIDAKGVKQKVALASNEKKNISGTAPFTILSADFSKVQVYFQGWRAYPVSQTTTTLKLNEMPVIPGGSLESLNARDSATVVTPSSLQPGAK